MRATWRPVSRLTEYLRPVDICEAGRVRVAGIDVGARRLDAVALDGQARVTDVRTFGTADLGAIVAWTEGVAAIGIDSPDRWSTAPHAADTSLSLKFRTARCAEIDLGRAHGIWVPWTTPVKPEEATWIAAGIDLFAALRARGHEPLEVFPHGVFRVLNQGVRPPTKRTREGLGARVRLLRAAAVSAPWPDLATHDALDATAAALVALRHAQGGGPDRPVPAAMAATCGHDGSAIWLPALRSGTEPALRSGTEPGSASGVAEASCAPLRHR